MKKIKKILTILYEIIYGDEREAEILLESLRKAKR
jgi:hypothetical protein